MFPFFTPEGRAVGGVVGVAALLAVANFVRLLAELLS